MRKTLLIITLVISALLLAACDVEDMGSLPDLARPYTGVYECENISLGGRDMTEKFEYIRIELEPSGTFSLDYRTAEGTEGSYGGNYSVDTEREEITLSGKQGARERSFIFPFKKGTICIDYNLYGTLIHAQFKTP